LASPPPQVTVTFSEHVSFGSGYLRVVDSKGRRVDAGSVEHPGGDGSKVTVGLRSGLPDDSYIVSYRVVSSDSHPIGGAFSFVVGSGLAQMFSRPLLAATLGTAYGRMLCVRLILLAVLAVLAVRLLADESVLPDKTRSRDEDLTAITGLGVLATYGGAGHAAS